MSSVESAVERPSRRAELTDDERVLEQCIDALHGHTREILTAVALNALVVGIFVWPAASSALIVGWWSAIGLLVMARIAMARIRTLRPEALSTHAWARAMTSASLVSGVLWGFGTALLFAPDDFPRQVLLGFAIGGMAAGASSSTASLLPAFKAYLIPSIVPLCLRFLAVGDRLHIVMGLMVALFGVLAWRIGRATHQNLVAGFRLRVSNEVLIHDLREAQAALTEANANLEHRVLERTQQLERETEARAEAEHQLHHAQKLEAVGRLSGGVAHDLNNLMAVVVAGLELVETAESAKQRQAFVERSALAAMRVGQLTQRLLAFSRRQALRPEFVDPTIVLRELVDTTLTTHVAGLQLRLDLLEPAWLIHVDRVQLELALWNIVVNAHEAMNEGGALVLATRHLERARPRVDLSVGDYLEIRVSDQGAGMAPDVLERAFDPFFTTKGERASGLGLSMVYGFVRQSGGEIQLASTPGFGTEVKLFLPRAQAEAAVALRRSTFSRGRGELVLLVEDEPELRRLATASLRSLGYEVVDAPSAEQALAILQTREDVDAIMTDIVLGGDMDGVALARIVAERWPRIPTLLVSGYVNPTPLGLDRPVLLKPYRKAELAAALAAMFP